jgi:hypothetical protein
LSYTFPFLVKAAVLLIYGGLQRVPLIPSLLQHLLQTHYASFRALFSSTIGAIVSKHCFWYFDVFSMLFNTMKD